MDLRRAVLILGLYAGAALSLQASPILTLTPFADLSGAPGSLAGWGFTITNDTDYIEITGALFCVSPVNYPLCASPTTGTFSDFISGFNDIIVGPGGQASQAFDALAQTGIGSFEFDPGAIPAMSDVGQIVLRYNVFDADPSVDPNAQQQNTEDLVLFANASVTVTGVPEPSTWGLVAAGALLGLLKAKRRA